jgi:hypothetical protein
MSQDNQEVLNGLDQEFYTPSELAKLTGQRPQAIYQMIRLGYIASDERPVTKTQTVVSKEAAAEHIAKYNANKAKRAEKDSEAQVEEKV